MYLVDTSVWIATFRARDPVDLEAIVPLDAVVTCLPLIQEVLQGFRDETAFRLAQDAMYALPLVESPLTHLVIDDAVQLYRTARRQGITIRSSTDCLVAACALRHDLTVLHDDRDYTALAGISRLKQQKLGSE